MDDPASPADALGLSLENLIRLARSGEKLMAAAGTMLPVATALGELRDYDPELAPEVRVAFESVQAAVDALKRAGDFIDARFDAAQARLLASFDQEGETS